MKREKSQIHLELHLLPQNVSISDKTHIKDKVLCRNIVNRSKIDRLLYVLREKEEFYPPLISPSLRPCLNTHLSLLQLVS